MASRKTKLTQSVVDKAQAASSRYVIADTMVPGFWLVVSPTGRKSFVYRYRVGGGRAATIRQPKIGEAPGMKAEAARRIAVDWSADVRKGGDPSGKRQQTRLAPIMADLFSRYMTDHAATNKRASSIAEDERLIRIYLAPAFSKRKVAEVRRDEVDRFHKGLAGVPYRANRCVALLSKAFNLAEVWGWRPDGSNPVRHVSKFPEKSRKRFLSPAEFARLGGALRQAELDGFVALPPREGVRVKSERVAVGPYAVAAIRLLALTGARKGEILGLRWEWVDFDGRRANLPDSKTGEKTLAMPPAALALLVSLPRKPNNPHVIAGGKRGAALVNLKDPWGALREAAGLDDVRIHDLRHSFAAVGAGGGMSLPMIGALLGHSQPQTTARYAHLADDPLQAAAATIGGRVSAMMEGASSDLTRLRT